MDRFTWCSSSNLSIFPGETFVHEQSGVRIYDGDNKTTFDNGTVKLTSHRVIWDDTQQQNRAISIPLSLVSRTEEQGSGFMSSAKVTIHLHPMPPGKEPGPSVSSPYSYIRFSFKQGGHSELFSRLVEQLGKKAWQTLPSASTSTTKSGLRSRGVGGIVGIERKLEQQSKQTDDNINKAFKDLDALMEKAKEMVEIADKVASKLEEKKGSITEDETVMFKSYLLSMGIDNPVTRDTVGTGANYHNELAKELGKFLDAIIKDEGGMMALSDVYCRFNRARGMELVSPEDLVNASQQFEKLRIPLRLRRFDSGVLVVQSISHSDEEVVISTKKALDDKGSLTAEELAHFAEVSVMLAKERLVVTEKAGKACRDDSVEGLRFYPNLFAEREA
ncbi:vacuolar protein-sorting-associated protein 36 [Nematostella vectensis]|uniref:vacuolar protein-sorting-associated protein 36 n=1 Tax=Nematostella vectensis TaxID=45351 RepID=UPI002077236A|nr:vacuolar protein-sorting-associated protein 36 [Nematostella vectensis]